MEMESRSRAIDKVYKRRDRIEMPDFQREEVWPPDKKKLLIDTMLRGWHIPKFYFQLMDDGTIECVDGQQRLVAIFEFFDDQLKLSEESAKRVGGETYSELPDEASDDFDDYEIDIEEIKNASEEELEALFQRLQLGTPLNIAEKLNAISGDLRDYCHDAAAHSFFKQKIGLRNTRYAHFQAVVMWAFIQARGIHSQMRMPQLDSLLRENKTFSRQSDTAKNITATLEFLDKAFKTKCGHLRNRANTLTVCMVASQLVKAGLTSDTHAKEFGEFIDGFFSELAVEVEKGVHASDRELLAYQQAITSGSTGGDSIRARLNIMIARLITFSPTFSQLSGLPGDPENPIAARVTFLADRSRELVLALNKKYSAEAGEDLFKMTTKSTEAILELSTPVVDKAGYGAFIDALYFLVYEGTGDCSRLGELPPDFAMDIKFLRGAIRHDLDHGKEVKVKKKQKRNAEIFASYSGKKSLDECGPQEFAATQMRILTSLVVFLEDL